MLLTFFILISVPIIYVLLILVVPKANNFHELLHLPIFWYQALTSPTDNLKEKKVFYGKGKKQYFLFFRPKKNKAHRKNIILYFHGGAWTAGRPEMFRSSAQVFVDQGYITVYACHRKSPIHHYEHMREDITLCLTKLVELQKKYSLEDKRIILGGISAGANLAALLLYNRKELKKTGCPRHKISGIFLCAAPLNLRKMRWSFPLYWYAGNRNGEKYNKANPIKYLQPDEDTPLLLIHGTKDGLVNLNSTISFLEKINEINPELAKYHEIENGTHLNAADWGHFDNGVRKVLMEWLEERE